MTSSPARLRPSWPGGPPGAAAGPGLWTRDFGLFFTARAVAKLGDLMLPVALATGLLRHGGGAGAVGVAMASFTACFACFVVFGGVLADRFDARTLMVGADAVRVCTELLAATLFLTGRVVLWQVCAIGAVNGVCAAMFQPGVASTVPRLVADVQGANGAIRTAESCMAVLGPAAAGVLVGLTSPGGVFAVHAATYLVSGCCLLLMRLPPPPAAPGGRTFGADLAEGWREFTGRPWMWGTIAVWTVFMAAAWGPSVPLIATGVIEAHGPGGYGVISSAFGGGMALGGLLAMRIRPRRPLRAGALALFGFCLQPGAVGAGLGLAAVTAACVVAGAAMAFWSVMWATTIQTQVPGAVLNRLHAYEVAGSVAMMPAGQALAGPAAGLFGAPEVLLAAGAVAVASSAALLAAPPVRDLTRTAEHTPADPPPREGRTTRPEGPAALGT